MFQKWIIMATGVLARHFEAIMADEQKPKGRKKLIDPENQGSILATTARPTGAAAGKTAPLAVTEPAPTPSRTKSTKRPKLEKKNKSRLPRRQKKAQQKVAATQGEA
jgi:hypothetical protein